MRGRPAWSITAAFGSDLPLIGRVAAMSESCSVCGKVRGA